MQYLPSKAQELLWSVHRRQKKKKFKRWSFQPLCWLKVLALFFMAIGPLWGTLSLLDRCILCPYLFIYWNKLRKKGMELTYDAYHIMNFEVPPVSSLIKKYICRPPDSASMAPIRIATMQDTWVDLNWEWVKYRLEQLSSRKQIMLVGGYW